jgi:hypothetical protein
LREFLASLIGAQRRLRLLHSQLLSFSLFPLFARRETWRPIELLAFGMGSYQGIGTQLEKVAAILKSKFSNHSFGRSRFSRRTLVVRFGLCCNLAVEEFSMARKCSHAALRSEKIAPPFEQPRDATSYYCEGQSEYLILHGRGPFVLVLVLESGRAE